MPGASKRLRRRNETFGCAYGAEQKQNSVPSMSRTCNPLLRTEMLYPFELWGLKPKIKIEAKKKKGNRLI